VRTNTAISSLLTRRVSGFVRKVYILHKRCCVAFAGSVLEAARLIPDLKDHLRKNGVEEQVLTEFLTLRSKGRPLHIFARIAYCVQLIPPRRPRTTQGYIEANADRRLAS
jgi:hypothetical protein